jgi:two-component system cell cycle response regulator
MDKARKILVIDSSRVSRKIIGTILMNEMGADRVALTAVGSGREALAVLEVQRFDLITSSVLLPDMDGVEVCRAVRRQNAHRFTPFIVVTAEPHMRFIREGYSAGVTDYYDKTQGVRAFARFIREFLERHAALVGKVLYLEDNSTDARVGSAIMAHYGLQVVRANSAEAALELLDDSFDLVVTDFFLERNLTGGDFLHNLRCGLRYSREELPVLVMTGQEDPSMQAQIFHAGGNDFITKPIVEEVFISRVRSLLLMKQQFTELRRHSDEMRRRANTDSLTGLHNQRYLMERAGPAVAAHDNYPLCVIVLDLDRFKDINDRHGHLIGDRVLEAVGRLLCDTVRQNDLVARMGGEEFVLLFVRRQPASCVAEMEALRAAIEALRPAGVAVTASIGVSTNLNRAEVTFNALLTEADQAMYSAKQSGRNRVVYYDTIRSPDDLTPHD